MVSVFDDHCCKVNSKGQLLVPNGPTRGLVLKLDMARKTASMSKQYTRGKHFYAAFQGDTDLLLERRRGGRLGSQPFFSEYGRSGNLLLDAQFPTYSDESYRAYARSLDRDAVARPRSVR